MHSCALTMAMLCGPKLVLVSYRPVADSSVGGQASRQAAGVIGTNQRRKSDRAQQNADVAVTTVRGAYGEWAKAPVAP